MCRAVLVVDLGLMRKCAPAGWSLRHCLERKLRLSIIGTIATAYEGIRARILLASIQPREAALMSTSRNRASDLFSRENFRGLESTW